MAGAVAAALAAVFAPPAAAAGRRVFVAFSGGVDSTALLLAAVSACGARCVPLRALHVDHALGPQAAQWRHHCMRVAAALDVPLDVVRVDIAAGGNLEARARAARHAVFARALAGGGVLLLGHHREDQAETVLLRLLRGSGGDGLAAMPARRRVGAGLLLRPLLDVPRAALVAHVRSAGCGWIEDPMNADPAFDRAALRADLLPLLRRRWPAADALLARAAANAADERGLRERLLRPLLAAARDAQGGLVLAALPEDAVVRRALLRRWLAGFDVRPSRRQLDGLDAQLHAPADRGMAWAGGGVIVRRHRGIARVFDAAAPDPAGLPPAAVRWDGVAPLRLAAGTLVRLPAERGLRWPPGGVCVQPRRGGERLRLPGAAHRRSVKALLREHGVPAWLRRAWPLLYAGGDLVCVPGVACADGWQVPQGFAVDFAVAPRAAARAEEAP